MEKIFRGVLKYRHKYKEDMVSWFHRINENPKPKAIFLTCVDSRMLPTRFTQTNPGDMYIARNVGNIMPHAKHFDPSNPFPEPAFLELGVEVVNIRHVVICGHSDCKAMGVLQSLKQDDVNTKLNELTNSPIKATLLKHGLPSLEKYEELKKSNFQKPLTVQADGKGFPAYIDVENTFGPVDKLSQIHALIQMENMASYPFMAEAIKNRKTQLHAMWFDFYAGELHYFSKNQKHFVPITDDTTDVLVKELHDSELNHTEFIKAAQNTFVDDNKKCC